MSALHPRNKSLPSELDLTYGSVTFLAASLQC